MCCTLDTFLLIHNSHILISLMKSVEEVKRAELKKCFNNFMLTMSHVHSAPVFAFFIPNEERVISFNGTGEFNLCSHFLFHSVN